MHHPSTHRLSPPEDAPTPVCAVPGPRAPGGGDPLDLVELRAASIADLVLKLTSLAERYERQAADPGCATRAAAEARLSRLRAAVARGRTSLRELVSAP